VTLVFSCASSNLNHFGLIVILSPVLIANYHRHAYIWNEVLGIKVKRGMVIRDMEVMLAVSLQILGVPIYYQRKFIHACKKDKGKSQLIDRLHRSVWVLAVLC